MQMQLLIGAGLLLAAIVFSRVSSRLSVPALVVFLFVGILAGPEGIGKLSIDHPYVVELLATIALISILFDGGLETKWEDLKPVVGSGLLLATIGLLISAALMAAAMRYLFDTTWLVGLLFGSIISCTDPAAVFSILRSRDLSLKAGLAPRVELESATNDPMAVFLALALIELIKTPGASLWSLIPTFFLQMGIGAAVGLVMGRVIPWTINTLDLEQQGLYPPLTLALATLTFAIASVLGGSGFLAAYLAGIVANTRRFYHKRSLIRFHSGFSWLLQIVMFLALGLLLRPSQLVPIAGLGILTSAFLIFFARPASVFGTLIFSKITAREKLMTSWLGLRGAVPIILATLTLYAGVTASDLIFNLVFFVVLLSVLVQGISLPYVARWLRVTQPLTPSQMQHAQSGAMLSSDGELRDVIVPKESPIVGRSIMSLGLGSNAVVMLIHRDGATLIPTGRTRIEPEDVLVFLAADKEMERVSSLMQS